MGRVRFVSRISKMGDRLVITIPKDFHEGVARLKDKQLRVELDDEFL